MTPDELLAHAQSETARADRERTMRIAAEERVDIWRETTYRVGLELAVGWFFDGVREVMRPDPSVHDAFAKEVMRLMIQHNAKNETRYCCVSSVCELLVSWGRHCDRTWCHACGTPPLGCAACTRKRLDIEDLQTECAHLRDSLEAYERKRKELSAEIDRLIADRDRWAAIVKRREEQLTEIRRVAG